MFVVDIIKIVFSEILDLYEANSVILLLSCISVLCIIIAALCLVGTLVDMFVVQQVWKFWVTSTEYNRDRVGGSNEDEFSPNGLSHHLKAEEAPLLSSHGLSSPGSSTPNVQIRQPLKIEDRGKFTNYM